MQFLKKAFIVLALLNGLSFSCTDQFDEINTNPNLIEKISPGTLLNPIIYNVASFNTQRADGFTFDIMQVAVPFPSVSGGVHRYDVSEAAGNSTWNTYYKWLANIREMQIAADAADDPNYQAIALTLNAWVYSLLTDSFGDVPMEEAVRAEEGIRQPTFNTQQEIYTKLLADLEKANGLFVLNRAMIYGTDILYANNVPNWQRFCNSLHLRLLLRVSKRTEMNAFTKMAQIIGDPAKYPVFTSNAEAAILKITGVVPNVSPWGRAVDFTNGNVMASFFVDNLNNFNDPRRAKFMTFSRTNTGGATTVYKGIPSGFGGNEGQFTYVPSGVNVAQVNATTTAPMLSVIMSYAEVEFIKAELAQQGKITGDAQTFYEKGVKAAIEQWGAVMPADYFTNPATTAYTAYNGTLERIMLQKYYALYFNDYQQWFESRRTGFPELPKGEGMVNNKIMPVRFRYPTTVITNNNAHYKEAVARMGGDDINTKVWWEK